MEEILRQINNYFYSFKETGNFKIVESSIVGLKAPYRTGQFIKVQGSLFNDGIYKVDSADSNLRIQGLIDEEFEGVIYSMNVPRAIEELEVKIKEFKSKDVKTNIVSESIPGGYSYSKATGKAGVPAGWQSVFAEDLRPYKKMYSGERRVKEFDK